MIKTAIIEILKTKIKQQPFINCVSREFSPEKKGIESFLTSLIQDYPVPAILINIQEFSANKNEEEEASTILGIINNELSACRLEPLHSQDISITSVLYKWSNKLDKPFLLVYHLFDDIYNETEKDILRSLRKLHRNLERLSAFLRILVISSRKISSWELFPESNLDERHFSFFEVQATDFN